MSRLRDLIATVFPRERILAQPAVSEQGRSFLVRRVPGDCVVGVRLDGPSLWPGELVSDALFACQDAETGGLVVALVELKGGDVGHAVDQLVKTAKRLCRGSSDVYSCHGHDVRTGVGDGSHHGRKVLGVVVGKQGLSQAQQKRAKARRGEGIVIKSRSARRLEMTCAELAAWVG